VVALQAFGDELAVGGEEIDDTGHVAAPYAVAVFDREIANRFTIGQFRNDCINAFSH
jgi:hypothetical protein